MLMIGVNSQAQTTFSRVISGFVPIAGGKTEWIDLDNNHDLDLLLSGSDGSATLTVAYENANGMLTQRSTNLPGLSAFATADYDKDGDTDILGFLQGAPFTNLYRNDGGFSFSQVVSIGAFSPSSAIWLDIENDEDLDALV